MSRFAEIVTEKSETGLKRDEVYGLALDNQALALTTKPWPWQPSPDPDTQINCWLAHEFAWVGLAEMQNQ